MDRHAMVVRLDRSDHEALRRLSFDRRMPMSELVRRAVHVLVSRADEQAFLLDEGTRPDHMNGSE